MKSETAFRIITEILAENGENGELGLLSFVGGGDYRLR